MTNNKQINGEPLNIKVDSQQFIEKTGNAFPSMNAKQTLKEVEHILRMNSGRVLKVEVTLSKNIYRTVTDTETITITKR